MAAAASVKSGPSPIDGSAHARRSAGGSAGGGGAEPARAGWARRACGAILPINSAAHGATTPARARGHAWAARAAPAHDRAPSRRHPSRRRARPVRAGTASRRPPVHLVACAAHEPPCSSVASAGYSQWRPSLPPCAAIDSRSVKTQQRGSRGYDGGKKVSGRKRHLLVDTLRLLLKVVVHPANLHDRLGAKLALVDALPSAVPRLQHIRVDQGSVGALRQWAAERLASTWRWSIPGVDNSNAICPTFSIRWTFSPAFTSSRAAGSLNARSRG
jgi:hypothetical protein